MKLNIIKYYIVLVVLVVMISCVVCFGTNVKSEIQTDKEQFYSALLVKNK